MTKRMTVTEELLITFTEGHVDADGNSVIELSVPGHELMYVPEMVGTTPRAREEYCRALSNVYQVGMKHGYCEREHQHQHTLRVARAVEESIGESLQ